MATLANIYNPVSQFYENFAFNNSLQIIVYDSYTDLLRNAPVVRESCILINRNKAVLTDKLSINLSFPSNLQIILVLNIEFKGMGMLDVKGHNFSLSNISFVGGDKLAKFPNHIVDINAQNLKLVNFEMRDVLCANSDLDFFRVRNGVQNFHMYNSLLSGKYVTGVFLRLDFPNKFLLKNCVFKDFVLANPINGGETIRMATGGFQNQDSFAVVDSCFFTNCKGDSEVISIKCSSVTIKNSVFSKNGGKKLTLRSTHKTRVEHCYFETDGIRAYGTKHTFDDIQLVDGANILLDNKPGTSYIVASDCKLTNIYHFNTDTPITNKGVNNSVTNLVKELKHTNKSFFKISHDPIDLSDRFFKFVSSNREIDNNVSCVILKTTDKFNVQYTNGEDKPYTFVLSRGNTVVSETLEKMKPYYLYGDIPKYSSLGIAGDYTLRIKETNHQINFKVE